MTMLGFSVIGVVIVVTQSYLTIANTAPPNFPADLGGGAAPCNFFQCLFSNPCHNGGQCAMNATDCTVYCHCPAPFSNIQLYDAHCQQRALNDSGNDSNDTDTVTVPCSLLTCVLTNPCTNSGLCQINDKDCTPFCICPEPYNNAQLFDSFCRELSSNVSTEPSCVKDGVSPPCQHGDCYIKPATNTTGESQTCRCYEGWCGLFCEQNCSKNCSNGGQPVYDETTKEVLCSCSPPWIGDTCEDLRPEPDESKLIGLAVGFSVSVIVILVVAAALLYYMWRKRLLFALKIAYYVKFNEDSDGKEFDAFVSYQNNNPIDLAFVCTTLVPQLEQRMGFKLCLQDRDFQLGATHVDNIMNFLENSRRFIIVLSTGYLKCEWRKFEFHQAFQEMLQRKLKIILVQVGDVDRQVMRAAQGDKTLNIILKIVVPYVFPGIDGEDKYVDTFWKKMRLSMPKLRNLPTSESKARREGENNQPTAKSSSAESGLHLSSPVATPGDIMTCPRSAVPDYVNVTVSQLTPSSREVQREGDGHTARAAASNYRTQKVSNISDSEHDVNQYSQARQSKRIAQTSL